MLLMRTGLGREWPRCQLHLWPRLRDRLLAEARPGPGLQSPPGANVVQLAQSAKRAVIVCRGWL